MTLRDWQSEHAMRPMRHRLPPPVMVVDLLPRERQALLELLAQLDDQAWRAPTICRGWSVHDIALHLLGEDRKSTRLNSSHVEISYAVFCLKKKKKKENIHFLTRKKLKKT